MEPSISDSCEELDLDMEALPFEVNLLEARRVSNRSSVLGQSDACVLTLRDATETSATENSRSRAAKRGERSASVCQLGPDDIEQIEFVIDRLGEESAKAQGLRAPITSLSRFIEASSTGSGFSQRIYVYAMPLHDNRRSHEAVALLKVGWKQLLLLDDVRDVHDVVELCILDFCVRAHHRRRGVGRKLFDSMLAHERRRPWELPIDNPSAKMRSFMRRHYGLNAELDAIPQLNKFTVFRGFFFECQTRMSNSEGQRDNFRKRCAEEHGGGGGGNDFTTRDPHEDHGFRHQGDVHKSRRWTENPIYGQRAPRHSSEHRSFDSPIFHHLDSSDISEKDNPFWCCSQEYNRCMICHSRSDDFRVGEHDLRTAVPRSNSYSSWRVLGLRGPGSLSNQMS